MQYLLVFISVVIPVCLSQDTCTQEIPENVINCTAMDSVVLTCMCNTYKPTMLEIVRTVKCLAPGMDFGLNAPTRSPYPVSPSSPGNISTPVSPTMYPPPISAYVTAQTRLGGGQSSISSLFNQELLGLIKNISSRIGEEVFDKACDGLPALQQCVSAGYKESTQPIDVLLKKFLNLDNLQQAMTSICNIKSEIVDNFDCITDASLPMSACVWTSLTGFYIIQPREPDLMSGDLNAYCPLVGDISRCMAIQAKKCSTRLGTTLQNAVRDILSPDCSGLAARGTNNPLMTTPMMCALSSLPESLAAVESVGANQPTSAEIQTLVGSMIDIYCGELAGILMCINEEMPTSRNTIDVFIQSIVDVSQFTYADTLAGYICKPSRVQAIKDIIPCVIAQGNDLGGCFRSFDGVGFNITTIGRDGDTDRMTYCGPIKNVTSCAIDSGIATCSADVAAFTRDILLTILRTDCNGVRNGDLQNVINAQRQDTTTVVNAAATLTNQRLPSIITVLVFMSILLL